MDKKSETLRKFPWRTTILVAVCATELLFVYLLRSEGLDGTLSRVQIASAIALFASPLLVVGVILLIHNGKISLRNLLIATSLLAIFIAVMMKPYFLARNSRASRNPFAHPEFSQPRRDSETSKRDCCDRWIKSAPNYGLSHRR